MKQIFFSGKSFVGLPRELFHSWTMHKFKRKLLHNEE